MGISIYYTARRAQSLTSQERAAVERSISTYAIENQLAEYFRTGTGYNWESFCVYDNATPSEPSVVFEGATQLPDNGEDALWDGLRHWCGLLSEIRRTLPSASWKVHVDDHDIAWDEATQSYDPTV